MNIVVIPEDFRNDQYVLKPLITRLFRNIGVQSVTVWVCNDPLLGGIGEALKTERLMQIVERRKGWADFFILCVDRDGVTGRRQRLNDIEAEFGATFLAENAWEELETWVLAAMNDLPNEWPWPVIRGEVQVKETYFDPYVEQRGLTATLGGGRKILGEEASRRIRAIRRKCPEDFDSLAHRLQAALA